MGVVAFIDQFIAVLILLRSDKSQLHDTNNYNH